MAFDELKKRASILPDSPGVYKFYDKVNHLIYVGKAKSIKKRVSSYFTKSTGLNRKTLRLISETSKIEYTVSNTEFDALLLENNLIKQNQPKYNILLKDDKTFPYICILQERFPRIISTRKYLPNQGEYFGPFSSVTAMKSVLELIRKLYTIRTCSYFLSQENIDQKKFKICLEFHIGNCKGPCEGLQSEHEYSSDIEQAKNILKGSLSIVEDYFTTRMKESSSALNFERAQFYKDKLQTIERFQSKSLVVNKSLTNIEVITVCGNENFAYINYLKIKEGSIIYAKSVEIKKQLNESDNDLLALAYVSIRNKSETEFTDVYSNAPISVLPDGIQNIIPKIGDKRKLVALSLKNAMELQKEKELLRAEKKHRKNENVIMLQKDLQLAKPPKIIECFDNSNLQGTTPVASMVRFLNGQPDKRNYRHYNIKTVVGANDFESMKEIVHRRYSRLLEEGGELPDLIVIDGGKGQLNSACEALGELDLKIPIVGIAKRLEEIYFPEDPLPLHISKKSIGLMLLQHIRDEAHRFAITFHRKKRSKATITSQLNEMPGIGEKTLSKLLSHFKSVKKIKQATFEELADVIGPSKAKQIVDK